MQTRQMAKMPSDHQGCAPPTSSSAPIGRRDPDQAPIDTASEQRERGGELYDAQDDGDPSPRVEAREHVLRVIDEEIRKP
jgi:hypothetical protein